ncbi:hypothetical protein EIP91_001946 [Steccherinum ochraceum]|uniref:Uncharacterized protein n=1 Tax=Steccherinum ochraceum TaxID=92696 RepID=A0A4R0RLJ4_9APHY|nr:hypothetical protein EIP91_001946 [Steccherinum ochraceum]
MPKVASAASSSGRRHSPVASSSHVRATSKASDSDTQSSASSSSSKEPRIPARIEHAWKVNNDIRNLFVGKEYTEEQWRKVEKYMRAQFKFKDVPTDAQIRASKCGDYFYGFYMSEQDIMNFAKRYNTKRGPTPTMTADDMYFIGYALSLVMDGWRDIKLARVVISAKHKEAKPKIVEEVGQPAYIVKILSTDDYADGFSLTNREISEIAHVLGKRPCWWESYE